MHIGGNRLLICLAYTCVVYCYGSTIYCYRSQLKPESSVLNMKSPLKGYVIHKSLLQMLFIDCLTCYLRELSSINLGFTTTCSHKIPGCRALCLRAWFPASMLLQMLFIDCLTCYLRELSSINLGFTTTCSHKIPRCRALCLHAWFPAMGILTYLLCFFPVLEIKYTSQPYKKLFHYEESAIFC